MLLINMIIYYIIVIIYYNPNKSLYIIMVTYLAHFSRSIVINNFSTYLSVYNCVFISN